MYNVDLKSVLFCSKEWAAGVLPHSYKKTVSGKIMTKSILLLSLFKFVFNCQTVATPTDITTEESDGDSGHNLSRIVDDIIAFQQCHLYFSPVFVARILLINRCEFQNHIT